MSKSEKPQAKAIRETAEDVVDNAPTKAEIARAQKDGVLQAAREDAAEAFRYARSNATGEASDTRFAFRHDIMQYEPLLQLGPDAFADRVKEDADTPVPEEKCAGLLELERSGQNRTPYVKALMDRLDIDSPYEVTTAGPGFTNDVQPVTEL